MEKKYTRKPIRNMADLEKAQDRARNRYKNMESDWVSHFLQPDTWAFSAGQYLLTGLLRKKNRSTTAKKAASSVDKLSNSLSVAGSPAGPFSRDATAGKTSGLFGKISGLRRHLRDRQNASLHTPKTTSGQSAIVRLFKKLLWSIIYWQAFRIGFRIGRAGGQAIRNRKDQG